MTKKGFDLEAWLASTGREIDRDGGRVRSVTIRRRFDAPIERVWNAWIDGWKSKVVSGDARLGQTVVLDLGCPEQTICRILICDPPERIAATWAYGEPTDVRPDEVDVRLARDGDGAVLSLEHRSESGSPWAAGIGGGWESGLMEFDFQFRGEDSSTAMPEANPRLDALWTELVEKAG